MLESLTSFELNQDSPSISAPFRHVYIEPLSTVNLEDKAYFDQTQYTDAKATEKNTVSKYLQKEAEYISQMTKILEEGRVLMYTLYAFRSCGKAIPQVQTQEQDNKEALYQQTCQVLRPEIYRMLNLMTFRDKLVTIFTEAMTGIIPDIKDRDIFPSETFLNTLANLLDLTISIDTMKNFKGSMSNDLSMYKRAKSMMAKEQSDPEIQVLPKLGFFLANKDQFASDLKTALATMSNTYEDVLIDMINLCMDNLEKSHYLLPATKHINLRAIAFALQLMDGEGDENDYNKKKKIKIDRIGKVLKAGSVVPLFGDIALSLGTILSKSPHWNMVKFDLNRLDEETKNELKQTYLLINQGVGDFKVHKCLVVDLKKCHLKLTSNVSLTAEESKSIYSTAFKSLKFLSEITNKVLEQAAWKYSNPVKAVTEQQVAAVYEHAVQHNYDLEEKKVLVQYISMIKSMSAQLYSMSTQLQTVLDIHISAEIQQFGKANVTEYYTAAVKKKKGTINLLKNIRDGLVESESDSISPAKERVPIITPSQLFFARSMLDLTFNEKSKGMKGGLMKEKNYKEDQIKDIQNFYDLSYYYPQMATLDSTIRECSDLASLWFKEFYLELTRSVQFRTSTSLPWILAETVLDSHETDLIQDLFVPLDLYNDAAFKTLYFLKSRFIYNEIEAEVNLCFDQFMFKLGKNLFKHYKKLSAIQLLEAENKLAVQTGRPLWNQDGLHPNAFENVLRQRDIKLLGRSVDISKILGQIVSQYLRQSIDTAIARFESSDLTYVIELESLLNTARLTHKMLSKFLQLERFDDLVREVNECITPCENNGRIVSHAVNEIVRDLIPNYCFNNITSRFLRSTVFYAEPMQRPNFPNAKLMYLYGTKGLSIEYSLKHGLYKDFVGAIHFKALQRLLDVQGTSVVSTELATHVTLIMDHTMNKFFDSITELCPYQTQIPLEHDNSASLFEYLVKEYNNLANYKLLKSEILQAFREIGNAVMVTKLLEETLSSEANRDKLLMQDIVSYEPEANCFLNKFEIVDQTLNDSTSPFSYTDWTTVYKKIVRATASKPTLVKKMLRTISNSLRRIPDYKEPDSVMASKSFARVWSSLAFVASLPSTGGGRSIRELFGDGLPIAGSALLYIFGQTSIYAVVNVSRYIVQFAGTEKEKKANLARPEILRFLSNANWFTKTSEECVTMFRNT